MEHLTSETPQPDFRLGKLPKITAHALITN